MKPINNDFLTLSIICEKRNRVKSFFYDVRKNRFFDWKMHFASAGNA